MIENLGNGVTLEMALVPSGSFLMGSPSNELESYSDESPQHEVKITEEFYLGKYLVTQEQWEAIMGENPSYFKKGKKYPVDSVSWNDCQEFIKKLNAQTGKKYRLPSEAEWEYACRAGTKTPFYYGETISTEQANYDGNYVYGGGKKGKYRKETTEVGSFPGNGFGLYDMHGNLWEWCEDDWEANYKTARTQEPYKCTSNGKVLRGGSWVSLPWFCRSANRLRYDADYSDNGRGFRLSMDWETKNE
jgi:formylglycine-generating enzyme required for sulfatase activity